MRFIYLTIIIFCVSLKSFVLLAHDSFADLVEDLVPSVVSIASKTIRTAIIISTENSVKSFDFEDPFLLSIFDIIGGAKILTTNEVTQLVNHEGAELVDIRNQKEFENGHIINAKNISLQELSSQWGKLKKSSNKGIILYCTNGSISLREAQKLAKQGEETIYCMKGGIRSWQNANLPLTKG